MLGRHPFASLALVAIVGVTSAVAQDLSVTVSPNPAPPGSTVVLTAKDASGLGYFTPNGCLIQSVRAGVPGGTPVSLVFCTLVPIAIPACGSSSAPRTGSWNTSQNTMGGGPPGPGLYWFEISKALGPFGPITTEWHSVQIDGTPPTPVLSAVNTPTWGSTFQLAINAPANPFETYAVALSASTNVGVNVGPGQHVCLDLDPLFGLTFPTPDPNFFVNFQGMLDGSGAATGIAINIPPLFIGCVPLHAQAATVTFGGLISLSNDLPFTIQ
jgi:hypothetical protein